MAASLLLLSSGRSVSAHRLDEYLQATTISLEKERVQAQIRLTPGVSVFPLVMATIDTDHDGVVSTTEQRAYAEQVLSDLSLAVDGDRLRLQLISTAFPQMDEMREGRGTIQVDFAADVPTGGSDRKLTFENRHQSPISTYLVNCLVPRDPNMRVTAQNRNYEQSLYRLEYVQGSPSGFTSAWWGIAGMLMLAWLAVLWRHRSTPSPVLVKTSKPSPG